MSTSEAQISLSSLKTKSISHGLDRCRGGLVDIVGRDTEYGSAKQGEVERPHRRFTDVVKEDMQWVSVTEEDAMDKVS